jgi:hypothetical protein
VFGHLQLRFVVVGLYNYSYWEPAGKKLQGQATPKKVGVKTRLFLNTVYALKLKINKGLQITGKVKYSKAYQIVYAIPNGS